MNIEEDYNEQEDEQIICEEYKIWKKNTPFLYDLVITHGLEWPSLTVNWFPETNPIDKNTNIQKLVVGTHTSGKENDYLMIAKARIPTQEYNSDVKDKPEANANNNRFEIETKINHSGEVNKARANPKKHNIIATKTTSGEVHLYNYHKHPPKPLDNICKPDYRLLGHSKEGYALHWSSLKVGYLLSGADDHKICIWDTNKGDTVLNPVRTIHYHQSVVGDVNWSHYQENLFASCGDDKHLILWDFRTENPLATIEAHSMEINSVDFSPLNEFTLITSSNDKTIALWDIRNLKIKLHSFDHHKNDILGARWNPNIEHLFASYSADRRVNVWDTSKIGSQQSAADAEDGPSELLFTHGGHCAKISDFDWNPKEPLMCASVSEDNIINIWEMANSIYYNDENEKEDEDKMRIE